MKRILLFLTPLLFLLVSCDSGRPAREEDISMDENLSLESENIPRLYDYLRALKAQWVKVEVISEMGVEDDGFIEEQFLKVQVEQSSFFPSQPEKQKEETATKVGREIYRALSYPHLFEGIEITFSNLPSQAESIEELKKQVFWLSEEVLKED